MGIDIAADRKDRELEKERKTKAQIKREKKERKKKKIKEGARLFREGYAQRGSHICTQCGRHGYQKTLLKGSFLIEIAMWLLFLFPGIIYSLWRHGSKIKGCPDCGLPTMIKKSSPAGKLLLKKYEHPPTPN